MAVTVDITTKVISVPQADLTHITGTLYELDTDWFRKQLRAIEASEEGIVEDDMHQHTTQYTVAGVTYARAVKIINGFSVQFTPNSQWSVRLAGSNNDIFDVEAGILVQNQVQVIPGNSAGLVVVEGESGLTTSGIADAVWDEDLTGHAGGSKAGEYVDAIRAKTDNLPTDPADQSLVEAAIATSESNIRGTDSDDLKVLSDQIDGVSAKTDNLPSDPASQSTTSTSISTSESNIRGSDSDDLKTLSDQLDVIGTDVTNLEDVLSLVKRGNTRTRLYIATEKDDIRKVAIGKLDRIEFKYKLDSDPDWSSPVSTQTLWAWYDQLGDDNPILTGEDG